ncbi:hypothetical protein J2W48_001593 [Flavobacterium piscis]|uniref:Uncharacterized protein n=1 Tax=Flavobacterium piscis TaxID=1114874 RepID=A0ABU1Y604_9FLAO|nr:hypothetical protein [Flavobacterium piscis]
MIINLVVCSISVLLGGFGYFFIMFLSFGFLGSIGFKELYRKSDYLFYANNGISIKISNKLILLKDGKTHHLGDREELIQKRDLTNLHKNY